MEKVGGSEEIYYTKMPDWGAICQAVKSKCKYRNNNIIIMEKCRQNNGKNNKHYMYV